ncbi:vegetative incompatibility protein HET-E-1 [Biomphalaria glabrata]|nr:vegetative incompatibility protein HET-E-1 [Biomphalaria glabrata]
MAMVKQYAVRDTHTRSITAIGYNPTRREIVLGFEDGVIKSWEAESGKLVQTFNEHKGWITDFLFWNDTKLLLSSANDAHIIVWGAGGGVVDKVPMSVPVYCMTVSSRRHQLICGVNGGIRVYAINEEKESGHYINPQYLHFSQHHTDIVRCVLCHESRIYSAGYDQRLIIYDSSYAGDNSLTIVFNNVIHDAGIACLVLAKDSENNLWLLTGSFDKTLKIWSLDGKLIHKLDTFLSTVSGICYIPRNKTIWAAGGTQYASMFDPKTGDNVSDFIGTFADQEEDEKYHLQILKFFPEFNQVVGSSNRRHFVVWKYNSSGCVTTLTSKSGIESLCYTSKVPILFFSGDRDGTIIKWERMQSNHFMYSKEIFTLSDSKMKKKKRAGSKTRELMLEQELSSQSSSRPSTQSSEKSRRPQSSYSFNKAMIPPVSIHKHPNTTILKIIFVESMDYILAASEDSNIYVWGFDQAAVQVLQSMKPQDLDLLTTKYAVLLDPDSPLLPQNSSFLSGNDSVTNRVAGFILKYVLSEHLSCVTSVVLIGRDQGVNGTFALSGGWDRRICLWDLEAGMLKDTCRSESSYGSHNELACDDIITDMDFNPKSMEFAYSCADKMVYIRKFSTNGSKMTLSNTLQGHEAEVTCVKWNNISHKWVTGAEDGTIRIWSGHGMNECEQVLSTQGAVTCLCIDRNHGSIIAGVQRIIKVYDADQYRLVQTNVGHTDAVRCIIHITERNQYVSCSWDETIRVWNTWKMPRRRHQQTPQGKDQRQVSRSNQNDPYPEINEESKKEDKENGVQAYDQENDEVLTKDDQDVDSEEDLEMDSTRDQE